MTGPAPLPLPGPGLPGTRRPGSPLPEQPPPDVLDPEVLADLLPLGPALPELLTSHDASFRAGLSQLSAAAACGDAREVGRLAHSLKGSSACLAARRVAALCEGLQTSAGRGSCPDPLQLALLRVEHERSLSALATAFGAA